MSGAVAPEKTYSSPASSQRFCDWLAFSLGRKTGNWRLVRRLAAHASGTWTEQRVTNSRGTVYELDLNDAHQRHVYYVGVHEPIETLFLERTVQRGWTALDVGANMGYFTLLLSRLVGETGVVHSFEPTQRMSEKLQRHIELNRASNVRAHHLALSDTVTETRLIESPGDSLSNTRLAREDEPGAESVSVSTLDKFVEESAIDHIDFIKIDIEGSEARFLRGAAKALKRWRPTLLIEINPGMLAQFGSTREEVISMLQELDYELLVPSSRDLMLPISQVPSHPYVNAVAVPRSRKNTGSPAASSSKTDYEVVSK
ncbi:MAG TPA: FkbM family methyltransferase [Terracidiphilus sp.]|nr:FkbM family methyltransferase [Terracidiphilus sp.]